MANLQWFQIGFIAFPSFDSWSGSDMDIYAGFKAFFPVSLRRCNQTTVITLKLNLGGVEVKSEKV